MPIETPPPLLSAKAISKRFGPNLALCNAAFSVRENEVLGLIGPNGSGKTTLFECLAGLIPTDSGEVEFRGRALAPAHRKQSLFYLPDGIRPWAAQPVHWVLSFFEAVFAWPKGQGVRPSITDLAAGLKLETSMRTGMGTHSR